MKGKARTVTLLIALCAVALVFSSGNLTLKAQDNNKPKNTDSSSKKKQDGLVVDWLNDFENCEDWRAVSTCPLGETKIRKIKGKPRPVNKDGKEVNEDGQPGSFKDSFEDENGIKHENNFLLGVKTYFMNRGFDRVEVFPPNEYIIRGKAREVKVWVLGRKFRHKLYIKFRDYAGDIHKIKIGRLDFWGWREMSVIVPGWLPQSASYAVLDMNLHFVSFYVESDRFERPGTFYFYLDQFRIVTDLSEFTGDASVKDNW
jgi:hypothetical protein